MLFPVPGLVMAVENQEYLAFFNHLGSKVVPGSDDMESAWAWTDSCTYRSTDGDGDRKAPY
ncbi:hypothetical protein [Thiohalorhabdus methylotrophus]|uniref:Uncharacterized protein n=1 Tax=Thiohalorhabdus methylotrophus TaxID=3242694 RepID=A0ABV4TYN7_9GAMM